tara:strand:- start:540 stop:767 length:228 start_codon:yes stop_codon:yes gene_type:complete
MTSKKRILAHPAVESIDAGHMQSFEFITYEVQLKDGWEYQECSFICEETYQAIWEELAMVKYVGKEVWHIPAAER